MVLGAFAGPLGLTPDEALRAVEPNTIGLLFGMMLVASGLGEAGASLAWSALVGGSLVLALAKERADSLLKRVDWGVLVFFAALFVVVAALRKTGLVSLGLAPLAAVAAAGHGRSWLVGVLMVGSQIVSNVPLILLLEPWIRSLPDPALVWTGTAVVSTLAGNLTVLGSVANVIVLEQSQEPIGFWGYARVGVPVTALSTAAALLLLR